MASSLIHRACPMAGNGPSMNSFSGSSTNPRSSESQASLEPIQRISSDATRYGCQDWDTEDATSVSVPFTTADAAASWRTSSSTRSLGLLTSSRSPHPSAKTARRGVARQALRYRFFMVSPAWMI